MAATDYSFVGSAGGTTGAGTTGGSTIGAGAGIGVSGDGGTASCCGGAILCSGVTSIAGATDGVMRFGEIAADFGATLLALTGFIDSLL